MRTKISAVVLWGALGTLVSACGGGDGGGGNNNGGGQPVMATLTLSGADTESLGTTVTLNYYAYREDVGGADTFLAATSSGVALDFVRVGFGELQADDIDMAVYSEDEVSAAVFNIFEFGISMRINIEGEAYLYSLTCLPTCEAVIFDSEARTVTLEDAELQPTIGGDADSLSLGVLTVSGALTWVAADEDPDAPALVGSSGSPGGDGSDLTLADLVGIWDATREEDGLEDESYSVFRANGEFFDYDYDGDSFDMGENCYYAEEGTIEDLGNGRFLVDGVNTVTFRASGDELIATSYGVDFFFRPTAMTEGDFTPLCE